MKTSEFIEKVEALEFVWMTERKHNQIFVRNTERVIASVKESVPFEMSTSFDDVYMSNQDIEKILKILTEYMLTPIKLRRDKTIEEKVREYIQEYVSDHLSFESARDFLESVDMYFNNKDENRKYLINSHLSHYTKEALEEYFEIYQWYRDNSNEFVKMWCEVAADES